MTKDPHDPHGIRLKEYYDPERDWISVVVMTSEDPLAMVCTEKRYTDKQQFPIDHRHVNTIQPYILLHETMILAYVHLINEAITSDWNIINPNDGQVWSDYDGLRKKVSEYEKMIGHYFLYDYEDDVVTLVKIKPENQHIADALPPAFRTSMMERINKEQT